MRFSLPGFARRKMAGIEPKPASPSPVSVPAGSLKKPIQSVLPIFGSTIAAADDRPKARFTSKETGRIE
jgi:hypothetical protein